MSQGTADYSVKGNLVYPAAFRSQSAGSMVILCSMFRKVSKIKGRGQKKTSPDLARRWGRSFFTMCHGLSVFAFYRIICSALGQGVSQYFLFILFRAKVFSVWNSTQNLFTHLQCKKFIEYSEGIFSGILRH